MEFLSPIITLQPGFHPVGGWGESCLLPASFPPPQKGKGKKEKRRETREEKGREEEGESVYDFGATIYLITLRLAEYHIKIHNTSVVKVRNLM